MSHRFRAQITFSILAILAIAILFAFLAFTTSWHWFINWIISANIVALVFYIIDKGLSKTGSTRVPEFVLHLLALLGGFVGAFLGLLVFRHKSNFREHPLFIPIIAVSAVLWGFLAYLVFWQ
jgi:uncharacterized membrane protein YsdA (DUF1294 family)